MIPIVIGWRSQGGQTNGLIGASVVINNDGWLLTAGHIVEAIDHVKNGREPTNPKKKITNHVVIVGNPSAELIRGEHRPIIDIGVLKTNWEQLPNGIEAVPLRSGDVFQGEMFCRAGFPFLEREVRPKWDKKNNRFIWHNLFPVPVFVNESLVSRFVDVRQNDQVLLGTWFETSTPGLGGQSGGPLLDSQGNVCGIQTHTAHYPLRFNGAGKNQVLNVGRAVRIDTIRRFLDESGIGYQT